MFISRDAIRTRCTGIHIRTVNDIFPFLPLVDLTLTILFSGLLAHLGDIGEFEMADGHHSVRLTSFRVVRTSADYFVIDCEEGGASR